MKDLDLLTLCQGIVAVKDNALELLGDAKILRVNSKLAQAYAAAYMACEENGKLSIQGLSRSIRCLPDLVVRPLQLRAYDRPLDQGSPHFATGVHAPVPG